MTLSRKAWRNPEISPKVFRGIAPFFPGCRQPNFPGHLATADIDFRCRSELQAVRLRPLTTRLHLQGLECMAQSGSRFTCRPVTRPHHPRRDSSLLLTDVGVCQPVDRLFVMGGCFLCDSSACGAIPLMALPHFV